jgi:hypothetical protein
MAKTKTANPYAVITAGGGGGAVAAWAKTVPEPYQSLATYAAPAIAALIVAVWPKFMRWFSLLAYWYFIAKAKRRLITAMDEFIASQKKRLEDPSLSPEARKKIEANIKEVERARADAELEIVKTYMQSEE